MRVSPRGRVPFAKPVLGFCPSGQPSAVQTRSRRVCLCLPKDKFVGNKFGRATARPKGSRHGGRESKGTKRQICLEADLDARSAPGGQAPRKVRVSGHPNVALNPKIGGWERGCPKAHSMCLGQRALLSDAILHRVEGRGSPSVANPLGGTRVHWTRVLSASPLVRPCGLFRSSMPIFGGVITGFDDITPELKML
jgi:hypothetical protein